jgi:hypothetical protein
MDEKQHALPPPVPPDALKWQWYQRRTGTEFEDMDLAAAWGWEQAIPERKELVQLMIDLANENDEWQRANELFLDGGSIRAGWLADLSDQARAAAERLRGGGSDG